ncbi:subtilisin-like protease SBT4.15 [Momordica charantia]|uniref:Subtilisin-like protease SBT4.15 n=1 Tax=Momordica charantia TaxID=3673 RepID=A0A6J1CSU9_MOMCH|nr:subtilisin-like protease SBT4.15 [Momordica charantia]
MLKILVPFIFIFAAVVSSAQNDRQAYVVYMGAVPKEQTHQLLADHHHTLLANAVGDEELARKVKIYSYGRSLNGFAARLLPHEANKLAKEKGVVSVFASRRRKLHTTRSWDFLGVSETASRRNAAAESGIIVGLLDSGIWMEAPSFKDDGYGSIPSKWKGQCVTGPNFTSCNRKVIGAKFFNLDGLGDSDNKKMGITIDTFSPKKKMYPLISGTMAATPDTDLDASECDYGSLDREKVKGKIVYCLGPYSQESTIEDLEGAGMIGNLLGTTDVAMATPIPSSYLSMEDGGKVETYMNSTKNPQAVIYKTTTYKMDAPFLASFSSRGPQTLAPNILKPDVTAPGLNILAAFSKMASIPDNRHSVFNILSGTSMSCPHAAAAAAYLKTFHPKWSPAALKSALMTTATPVKTGDEFDELGIGAGQINPAKAIHPGLIYDISVTNYVSFLCSTRRYDGTALALLVGDASFNCSGVPPATGSDALNYPTMYAPLDADATSVAAVFHRTVTHVGFGPSTYRAKVKSPAGVAVRVVPEVLKFDRPYEKRSFKVAVRGPVAAESRLLAASLEWNDSKHNVRTQIVMFKI